MRASSLEEAQGATSFRQDPESKGAATIYLFQGQLQGHGNSPNFGGNRMHPAKGFQTLMYKESILREQNLVATAWRQQISAFQHRLSSSSSVAFVTSELSNKPVDYQSRRKKGTRGEHTIQASCLHAYKLPALKMHYASCPVSLLRHLKHGFSRLELLL